jgi:hypothetical protein
LRSPFGRSGRTMPRMCTVGSEWGRSKLSPHALHV